MIMPSLSVALVAIVAFAALAALDWFVGGLAYRGEGRAIEAADLPRRGKLSSIKDAA